MTVNDERGHAAAAPPAEPVPDYLVLSILITLLCCIPGGVVGIVFSSKANKLKTEGNFAAAREAAETARIWCFVGLGVGLVFWIISVLGSVLMVVGLLHASGNL